MARPQSHRPATSVPERELSPAGRLELSIWRTSAQALADFRTRSYSPSETERALGDAVGDNRFGPAAVYSQRLNMKLYFAITRLMRRRGLHELPWPQRELDNLLDEFESEPSIREINIDFLVVAHKLIRNGAFDHLIGLTTTIVSIQYLPGVKKLMDRRLLEQVPAVRYNDSARVLPPQTGVRSPRTSLHRPIPSPINTTRFPPNVIPTEAIKSATTEIKSPLVKTPLIAISNPENIGAATPTIQPLAKVTLPGASSASKAIVQEGLEALSEPNMMPFVHQYELLCDVLRMLERSSFFWAKRVVPDVLKQKKWGTWQKVELLDWMDYFSILDTPLEVSTDVRSIIVGTVIPGLRQMRNDAIRRKELPIMEVISMMQNAQALAKVLRDDACFKILLSIGDRLIEIENQFVETRNRLKQEFQIMASKISKKFTDMMEAEIKDESFNNQAKLVKHNESAEWNFRFEAPSDGHYSGEAPPTTAVAAAAVIPEPIVEPTRTPFENAPHKRSTPGIVQEPGSGSQPSEAESLVTASTLTGQGPPPSGTAEYESFWIAFRNSSTNLPPVSLVKEALDIDGKTWEELRQDATNKIEENDLIELRWKEIQAAHPAMIQNFKGLHMNLFTKIKSTTFMELLCELTFHSARRGILERGRRKQHRQKVKEDVPATSGDPRLKNREARQAKTRGESVNTVSPRNAAAGSYEARLAHFEQRSGRLHALRASTNAVNRQAAAVVEGDAPARRYSPRKRSLSPSEDRQDVPKKVKLEPLSQDDTLSVVADLIDGESTAGTLPDYVSLN